MTDEPRMSMFKRLPGMLGHGLKRSVRFTAFGAFVAILIFVLDALLLDHERDEPPADS